MAFFTEHVGLRADVRYFRTLSDNNPNGGGASRMNRAPQGHLRSARGEQRESEEHQEHEQKDARENLGDRE